MTESQARDVKFFVEKHLESLPANKTRPEALKELLNEKVCDLLETKHWGISLASIHLDEATAKVVQKINKDNPHLPIVMWITLPDEDGYWLNETNIQITRRFTKDLENWVNQYKLNITGFGFDIEPPLDVMKNALKGPKNLALTIIDQQKKIHHNPQIRENFSQQLNDIISDVKHHGIPTEAYVLPWGWANLLGIIQKSDADYTFSMIYTDIATEPFARLIPKLLRKGQYPAFGGVGLAFNDGSLLGRDLIPGKVPKLNTQKELQRDMNIVAKMNPSNLDRFRIFALTGEEVINWTEESLKNVLKAQNSSFPRR